MNALILLGLTFDTIGTILIAYTVLRVHSRVRKEHRIDEYVAREMQRERTLGIAGIVFIVIGYALQLIHYGL